MRSTLDLPRAAGEFRAAMGGAQRVFAFYGAMGAGKTTFIRAVCKELGVPEEEVSSPSFAIVNEYAGGAGRERIYHMDFYRIRNISEIYDLGCEEYFYGGGTCFIEWPELAESLLPPDAVKVKMEALPGGERTVTF